MPEASQRPSAAVTFNSAIGSASSLELACLALLCVAACGGDSGDDGATKLDAGPGMVMPQTPANMHSAGSGGMAMSATGSGGATIPSGSGGRGGTSNPNAGAGSGGGTASMHDAGTSVDAGAPK